MDFSDGLRIIIRTLFQVSSLKLQCLSFLFITQYQGQLLNDTSVVLVLKMSPRIFLYVGSSQAMLEMFGSMD